MSEFNYIAVEGIQASGRSQLARFLAERLDATPVLDETENNPFLKDFHANPVRFALSAQIFFLVNRYQQLKQLAQPDLFERKKVADFIFARDAIFAKQNLNPREYSLYQSLSKLMEAEIPPPDLVVYLQTPASLAFERLRRGKTPHPNLILNQLENLAAAFDQYFFHYDQTPLLIVNTANLDLFNRKADLETILSEINMTTFGTRYFTPIGKDVLL